MTCAAWQTTSAPSSRLAGLQLCYLFYFISFEVISSSELKRSTRLVGQHKLKRMLLRCRSLIILRTPYPPILPLAVSQLLQQLKIKNILCLMTHHYQVRASNMVRAGESLMKLVSDLKQYLILNDFPSVNEAIAQNSNMFKEMQVRRSMTASYRRIMQWFQIFRIHCHHFQLPE